MVPLDWKNNQYDFHRLTCAIIESLDCEYRGKWGVCVDELASEQEILEYFQTCRAHYDAEPVFQRQGIYLFLRLTMDLWLGGKVCDLLDMRREKGEALTKK